MGRKRKAVEEDSPPKAPSTPKKGNSCKKKKKKVKEEDLLEIKKEEDESSLVRRGASPENEEEEAEEGDRVPELDPENLPSTEVLSKLLDRMEMYLPKDDKVKYDSQARKMDWDKISFEELNATQCQMIWTYIQERIRRFRILSEMIPDAREWIHHPWTNFYKSKGFNRHPDMPKKPLSMYMLFYSQQMSKILKENPNLSMPEVAKICSEQYQKLSEKKKNKYKQQCEERKKEYEERLKAFYEEHPDMRPPSRAEKKKTAAKAAANLSAHHAQITAVPHQQHYQLPLPPQQQKLIPPLPTTTYLMTTQPVLSTPPSGISNNIIYDAKYVPKLDAPSYFPGAPERPPKPFDLYFKTQMESHASDPNFDRQAFAQTYRKEWKEMKVKKKAKWIKAAADNYRQYEGRLKEFMSRNPGYVRPIQSQKNFLTMEDQKILDKFMGRPEKPSSSAYSLFSKEMLNNEEIKKHPSKERMSHISEKWKILPHEQKERYQAEVNESMSIYRQQYEDWFNGLSDEERKAETDRMTSKSSKKANLKERPLPPMDVTSNQILSIQPPVSVTMQPQTMTYTSPVVVPQVPSPTENLEKLKNDILKREPVELARSRKQLFIQEWLSKHKKKRSSDAEEVWKSMTKKEKKKIQDKWEPLRQKYIEDYTVFVRGLDKQELEIYTELKKKRDEEEEARRQNESSDSEDDSESSDSESDSDSGSD